MIRFSVNKKTGFSCSGTSTILILDSKKRPFYYREGLTRPFAFNLPFGTYYSNVPLRKLDKPVFYTMPKLKRPYHFQRYPGKFKIIYANNPNKCSVNLDRGIIIFDNSFKHEPRFVRDFIKFHELGHYHYSGRDQESEVDCDTFAAYCMITIGYNPLQARVASRYSLGNNPESEMRKKANFNYLQSFRAI